MVQRTWLQAIRSPSSLEFEEVSSSLEFEEEASLELEGCSLEFEEEYSSLELEDSSLELDLEQEVQLIISVGSLYRLHTC